MIFLVIVVAIGNYEMNPLRCVVCRTNDVAVAVREYPSLRCPQVVLPDADDDKNTVNL